MDMKISSTLGLRAGAQPDAAASDAEDELRRARPSARSGPSRRTSRRSSTLNRGELVTEGVELKPLTPRQVEQKRSQGALLVDVRTDLQFDDAHIPDAVVIPAVQAGFGTRLAWIADRDQEIVLIGRDDEDARRAGTLAPGGRIHRLGGFLHGGMTEWRREGRQVARIERIDVDEVPGARRPPAARRARAVRARRGATSPGSLFEPWHDIHELPEGLDPDRPGRRDVRLGPARGGGLEPGPAPRREARHSRRGWRGAPTRVPPR